MNKIFNTLKSCDKTILLLVLILGFISLLMLESTIYDGGFVLNFQEGRPVIIQAISYFLGFICIFAILAIDYNFFYGLEKLLYGLSILALLTVYVPGLGISQYGARSWIDLGITTVQPSEFVKISFVLIMAGYLSEHKDELHDFKGVLKAVIYAAPIIAIVLKEDLGSALVFASMWIFMVFFAGIDYKVFFQCAGLTVAMVIIRKTVLRHSSIRIT